MFRSLAGLVGDVVKIAAAPIEITADLTRVVTKPVADAAEEVRDAVKGATADER